MPDTNCTWRCAVCGAVLDLAGDGHEVAAALAIVAEAHAAAHAG